MIDFPLSRGSKRDSAPKELIPANDDLTVHFLCIPKENEPKEKALSREAILMLSIKTVAQFLNRFQGFSDSLRNKPPLLPRKKSAELVLVIDNNEIRGNITFPLSGCSDRDSPNGNLYF